MNFLKKLFTFQYNLGRATRPRPLPTQEVKIPNLPNKKTLSTEDLKQLFSKNKTKKALNELTKEELLTFVYNYDGKINVFDSLAECAVCGEDSTAIYHYECENCQNRSKNET